MDKRSEDAGSSESGAEDAPEVQEGQDSPEWPGALTKGRHTHYVLRLFVTGTTPQSTRAISNIKAVCDKKLDGQYDLEVIDIYQQPELAKTEQIIAAPTLIKSLPLPLRKLIGNLSDMDKVLVGLGLQSTEPPA